MTLELPTSLDGLLRYFQPAPLSEKRQRGTSADIMGRPCVPDPKQHKLSALVSTPPIVDNVNKKQ